MMTARSTFQSSGPVVGADFVGREDELSTLMGALDDLKHGVRRLYCVLGPRKIGKTSLFEELIRRIARDPDLLPCRVDLFAANTPRRFFIHLSLALLDSFLKRRTDAQLLSGLMDDETALTLAAAKLEALKVRSLDQALRSVLELVRGGRGAGRHFPLLLDLPAELARESGLHPVVIIDEFQEVRRFDEFKEVRQSVGEILKLIRSRWQVHAKVAYLISGSEVSLIEEMVSSPGSPLSGHFVPLRLSTFSAAETQSFLAERFALAGRDVPLHMRERLVALTGGHPFYLQILGEELCLRSEPETLSDQVFKETLQDALFSSAGRLQLHFAHLYERHVGRSTTLEQVLVALATGHASVTAIGEATGQKSGSVSTALRQLMRRDLVGKDDRGRYAIVDPTFALWVAGNRSLLRAVAGPYYLGSEAERAVCILLAREGFQLIYRSRASRGAFDLLALLGTVQIGLQVKRSATLPVYLSASEQRRMVEWGRQLEWIPVLALYDPEEGNCLYFDVRDAGERTRKGIRCEQSRGCDQLLRLL